MSPTTDFQGPPPTPPHANEPQWRSIPGYEGLYEVSQDHQIRVVKTGRVLKPLPITDEYPVPRITLYKDGKYKRRRAHCWAALAWNSGNPV